MVQQEIDRFREGLDKNPVDYYHAMEQDGERQARIAAAEYINAQPGNIALTGSTSQALAVVYSGIKVAPHQEILSTTHDHAATFVTLGLRAQRMGTKLRSFKLYDPGVNRLFFALCAALDRECGVPGHWTRPEGHALATLPTEFRSRDPLVPAARARYLADIAQRGRESRQQADARAQTARLAHGLYLALQQLGDPALPAPFMPSTPSFPRSSIRSAGSHPWRSASGMRGCSPAAQSRTAWASSRSVWPASGRIRRRPSSSSRPR
jgi:hypothetical protein